MIPRKLTLSSFLSYDEPVTLHFSEIHLACISGLNGAGKSSILDGITWALFGQSRGKDSDDIINRRARRRKKKAEAEVRFEFQIGPNIYQVIRRKPLQKTTLLEFQIAMADHQWKTLTESKLRQTQQAIENLLHLNYESFISTNFFLQGKADEFAIKTPDKRKEILAELLGLHQWDRYKTSVSKHLKTTIDSIATLSARTEQEEQRIGALPNLLNDREVLQENLLRVSTERETREKQLEICLQEAHSFTQKTEEFEQQIQQLRKEVKQLTQKKEKVFQEHEECRKLLADSTEIQTRYQDLQKLEAELDEMRKKADQLHQIRESKRPHELAWEQKKQQLVAQCQSLASEEKKILKKQDELLKLEQKITSIESRLQPLKTQQDTLKQEISALQETHIRLKGIETQQKHISATQEKLQQRLENLKNSSQEQCPLCEQTLSQEHRSRVLEQLETEQKKEQQQFQKLKSEIWTLMQKHALTEFSLTAALTLTEEKLKGQQQKLHLMEEQQKKELPQLISWQEKKKTFQEEIVEWEQTQKEIWIHCRKRLEMQDIDPELARLLKEFEAQEAQLGYSTERRLELQKKMEPLASVKSLYLKLNQATSIYQHRAEQLQELQQQLQEKELLLKQVLEKQELWKMQHPFDPKSLEEKKADVSSRKLEERQFQEKLGGIKQKIIDLEQLQVLLVDTKKTLTDQRLLMTRLERLELACSRKGVQALLIEQAIPEIENDANQILTRLTQGEMQLLFKTQKTLKNREEQVETLDIEIVDPLGERPYENFSGGEQFRINFAIRLALSKMLARRAGAELQMLVIDEGFASQDPQGIQNLVEAIHIIQDEFACILVITHMEELREYFPVQIWIEKKEQGSTLSVR